MEIERNFPAGSLEREGGMDQWCPRYMYSVEIRARSTMRDTREADES